MMFRWIAAIGLAVVLVPTFGCGVRELGPVDPADVKEEDPTVIKKGMEESAKHLPKGARIPPGVLPEGAK